MLTIELLQHTVIIQPRYKSLSDDDMNRCFVNTAQTLDSKSATPWHWSSHRNVGARWAGLGCDSTSQCSSLPY